MPLTLASSSRFEPEPTKGSRFIASMAPVSSETDAKRFLSQVASEMPDASHHCWAWRIARPAIERAGDDGEPGGSAGRPMLAQLTGRDLTNVAVVVTRYFGGTKLGVGGLVRAYGGAVGAALDQVSLVEWVPMCELVIQHEHADSAAVERALARGGATDIDVSYSTIVERRIRIAEARRSELDTFLADGSSGRIRSEPID